MNDRDKEGSKDQMIRIRITKEERDRYFNEAKKLNISLSKYILDTLRSNYRKESING